MLGSFGAGAVTARALSKQPPPNRPGGTVLRLAHLTDVHVRPDGNSRAGLTDCLRHVHTLSDVPDLILNGGDAISDAFHTSKEEARGEWEVWHKVVRDECRLPMEHCLGNHDLGGDTGGDPACTDGKRRAMEALGLERRYRSFDRAGWHFVVLDSVTVKGNSYQAQLDDAQFQWLEADLLAVKNDVPVLILSHVPILTVCAYFDGDNEKSGDWVVPGRWMHIDARRLKELFRKHTNVRLCLSGHIHLRDRVEYDGVTYICDGAVSGNWWNGPYQGCPPGYGLVDLRADGGFEHRYVAYS
jgi:hypothetical protein